MHERLHFAVGLDDEARDLVIAHHYSKRVPSNVQLVCSLHEDGGLFGDLGRCVAACFFSIPPTRWSEPVWELSRLVATPDGKKPLSSLLSKSIRFIKRSGMVDLIVSFADATQNHVGYVYQASSWRYDGKRDRRVDGCIVDGAFWPGRSCNSRWGTRSPSKLTAQIGRLVEPHYDEGKHLYWLPLFKSGEHKAKRLGLTTNKYPKHAARLSDAPPPSGASLEHTQGAAPTLSEPKMKQSSLLDGGR